MTEPLILDVKALARQLEKELAERVEALRGAGGRTPVLATILVGDDPASATYVKMKGNACRRVGMDSRRVALPEATTTAELLAAIDALGKLAGPDRPRSSDVALDGESMDVDLSQPPLAGDAERASERHAKDDGPNYEE